MQRQTTLHFSAGTATLPQSRRSPRNQFARCQLDPYLSAKQPVRQRISGARKNPPCFSDRKALIVNLFEVREQVCAYHVSLARFFDACPMDDTRRRRAFRDSFGI